MEKEGIIKSLKKYFNRDFRDKLKREETVEGIVTRLRAKRRKIKRRLEKTKGDSERSLLKKRLKVIKAQLEKAKKLSAEETSK
jgi:DNA polymerase elongation subunit (family B)